jgi:hypothetical protein
VPVPGIWASPSEVGSNGAYYLLPDMKGQGIVPEHSFVAKSAFTVLNHSLIYWSPLDVSACIATPEGAIRWYSFKRWLTNSTDVNSLYASNKYIYLNVSSQAGPFRVLRLVPKTGQISVVFGVVEVRAHDNSSDIAGLSKDGTLQFYTDDQIATSPPLFVGRDVDWDGDAGAKMVCWRIGHHISTWDNGRTSGFDVDMYRYRGMSLYTAKHIIWISSDYTGFAIWSANALVHRYNGSYLGAHLFCSSPAYPPMYPSDPIIIKIAHRLSTSCKPVFD